MRLRAARFGFVSGLLLVTLLTACQSQRPIEYQILITQEVTRIVIVTATPEGTAEVAAPLPDLTTAIPPSSPPGVPPAEASVTPAPTTDPFPAPIINEVIVAEQAFQTGRMFYLQTANEIWVLLNDGDGTSGTWIIEQDTWADGMAELDPTIQVPEGLYQPERGFGKLWRENEIVRNGLGFATDTEYGHVTSYTYTFGGTVDASGQFIAGPGVHTVVSREGTAFIFDEATMTWRLGN